MEQLTATAGAVGSTFVNMGMQVLDGARAGVRGPSAQAEAWRADVVAHQIGNAELRAEIEQLRQRATRAEGERDAANAAMLRGCKEEIADLVAEKMLAKQQTNQKAAECRRRQRLALVRDPSLWQPVATDLFKKCLVPKDGAVVLLMDLISAFARSLAVSPLDQRLSVVLPQDLSSFCDELEKLDLKTHCIIQPFKDVLRDLGMTVEALCYFSSTIDVRNYRKGFGLKGYYLRCGTDVVCRSLCKSPTTVVRAKFVTRARWNRDEEERLKKLVEEHGAKRSWQKISEKLGSGRTASGVEQHWQVMTGQRQRNGATVPKENQAQHPNTGRISVVAPDSAAAVVPDRAAVVPDEARRLAADPSIDLREVYRREQASRAPAVAAPAVDEDSAHRKPRKAKAKAPVKKPTVTKAAAKKKASSSRRASECWDNTDDRHWVTGVGWKSGPKPVTEPSSRAGRRAARRADSDSN